MSNEVEQGVFQIDFIDGQFKWANKYALDKLGYDIEQLKLMSVFTIVPQIYHESIKDSLANRSDNFSYKNKKEIWPMKSYDGNVIWWLTSDERVDSPDVWIHGEYLEKTPESEKSHVMTLILSLVHLNNELSFKQDKHTTDIHELQINGKKMKENFNDMKLSIHEMKTLLQSLTNATLKNSQDIKEIKNEIDDALSRQTLEILKLISSDNQNNEKLKVFETSIKDITKAAAENVTSEILDRSKEASSEIVKKTEEAGKNISRKIVIPVSAIAAVFTIVQWIIMNFFK